MKISTMIKKLNHYKESCGDIEIYADEEANNKVISINNHSKYGDNDKLIDSYLVIYSSSK